ncbi:Retrovirus-related Pol polyprotein from transposon 17.6 [Gossypium australe]|uniref:Retrovirus-related Pol polyprotein from transposon 17.6 n=1 Tax=Gossypium australe TaxID=47621 RepID=A0A5B6VHM0_9ROSI|nr:Retrovirus-related Pol polyprotein from transposon 17.6 [Gossypium australe]
MKIKDQKGVENSVANHLNKINYLVTRNLPHGLSKPKRAKIKSESRPKWTARKILDSRLYWKYLFKDAYQFCKSCERCQRVGALTRNNEMPQVPILICEIFDV